MLQNVECLNGNHDNIKKIYPCLIPSVISGDAIESKIINAGIFVYEDFQYSSSCDLRPICLKTTHRQHQSYCQYKYPSILRLPAI